MKIYLNNLTLLLKKLGIAFLIFSLCRLLFYLVNSAHFTGVSVSLFFYGLRFDLVAIAFLFAPLTVLQLLPIPLRRYKWYSTILSVLFYLANTTAIVLNLIDVAYFDFSHKRTTADFFSMLTTGDDFLTLLPLYVIDFWYDYIFLVGLLLLSRFLYKKYCKTNASYYTYKLKDYIIHTSIFIISIGCLILCMRGGFQYKPISIINAGQYAIAQNTPIVLNTPFTVLKTFSKAKIEPVTYFNEDELLSIYTPHKTILSSTTKPKKNVVIIILESFAKEYVGGYNNGKGYTPFIDSLLTESYVFTNAYANGIRSIEALPCILSGFPQLMTTPYVLSNYSSNQLSGLPQALKEIGYNTSFYHGGANGTMGFNGFVGSIGVDNYYGIDEYPQKDEDFDGNWGIFDEPYFQYYAAELSTKKEPFFSTLFTVSSHHPYTIPKKHIGKFPKGDLPLHETIGYTDYALKQFFESIKKMPWFNNTLFFFTADHSSLSKNPKYTNRKGLFEVPAFIYDPSGNLKGKHHDVFQHLDIYPSMLSLLGINTTILSFGNNAFSSEKKFSIQHVNSTFQITTNSHFLIFDGEKTTSFYNLENDSSLANNIVNTQDSLQLTIKNDTEKLVKAIIQQYNNRLINNEISIVK